MIGFYPHQVLIQSMAQDGFRFGEMRQKGDLLCLPSGMFRQEGEINVESLIDEKIDYLIIGTGAKIIMPSLEIKKALRENNISFEVMQTKHAFTTYNILLAEQRRVGAILVFHE